jgi:hypothetical protein
MAIDAVLRRRVHIRHWLSRPVKNRRRARSIVRCVAGETAILLGVGVRPYLRYTLAHLIYTLPVTALGPDSESIECLDAWSHRRTFCFVGLDSWQPDVKSWRTRVRNVARQAER